MNSVKFSIGAHGIFPWGASAIAFFAAALFSQIPSTPGWYEVPNTKISPVCEEGPGTCAPVIAAWGGGVFDTQRNRMIIWGGGHNDYYGNEIYAVNFNGTPSAERLTDGCFSAAAFSEFCTADSTQPQSRHTYGGISYMANVDRLYCYRSPTWNGDAVTWTFSFADMTWYTGAPIPNQVRAPVAYDPNSGKSFIFDGINLWSYTFETDRYQKLDSSSYTSYDGPTAVVDPLRKKFVLVGNGKVTVFDLTPGGAYAPQTLATTGGGPVVSPSNTESPGVAYDPVSDRIVAWSGGDTVYCLNLDNGVWTSLSYPNGPGPAQTAGTWGRWQYAPALGAFVLVNAVGQNAFVFRFPGTTKAEAGKSFDGELLQLSPNPAKHSVTVSYRSHGGVHSAIDIFTLDGKKIKSLDCEKRAGLHQAALNARSWTAGVYLARLTLGKKSALRRLTVIR